MTSWRTRHYAYKESGIRDSITEEDNYVEHVRGVAIIADPLTQVLPNIKLLEAYQKLQLKWEN